MTDEKKTRRIAFVVEAEARNSYYARTTYDFTATQWGARNERGKSGYTSIRVDKDTAQKFNAMREQLPKLLDEQIDALDRYSYRRTVTLTELMQVLASASLRILPDVETSRPKKVHARSGSRSPRAKVHAKSPAVKRRKSA